MDEFQNRISQKTMAYKILGFALIAFRLPAFLVCVIMATILHLILWPMPSKLQRFFILLINFVLFRIILLSFGVFFVKTNYRLCSKNKRMFPIGSGKLVLSNIVSFLDVFYLNYLASPWFLRTYFEKIKGDLDPSAEESRLFEPLGFSQLFQLAFSKDYVKNKPFKSIPNEIKGLATLGTLKRKSASEKHGALVIFFQGKKTDRLENLELDSELMKIVHTEIYKDQIPSLELVKFNYSEDNIFPVYYEGHWLINLLRVMANPYVIINVSIYNCVLNKKFPMEKERILNIVKTFYSDSKEKDIVKEKKH